MLTYEQAKQVILKEYADSKVVNGYQMKDGYLFSIRPKAWDDDKMVLDGYFKVDSNEKISEYSPVKDPEEFKEARKNILE